MYHSTLGLRVIKRKKEEGQNLLHLALPPERRLDRLDGHAVALLAAVSAPLLQVEDLVTGVPRS